MTIICIRATKYEQSLCGHLGLVRAGRWADADHAGAQATNDRLLNEDDIFVTSNFVLAEAITLIRYHLHHTAAVRFHQLVQQMVASGLVEVVRISEEHETNA